ncbi:MAG: amylo-alpha-1,6-glucosidase [Spirochaetia bacterium]
MNLPELDLDYFAFSRRNTNWVILTEEAEKKPLDSITLRYIYGGETAPVYDLTLTSEGKQVPLSYQAFPHILILRGDRGVAELIMPRRGQIRIRCRGTGLRLSVPAETAGNWEAFLPIGRSEGEKQTAWRCVIANIKHDIRLLSGELFSPAQWGPKPAGDRRHQNTNEYILELSPEAEILITDYESENGGDPVMGSFEKDAEKVKAEMNAWHSLSPEAEPEYGDTSFFASYITWSSFVPASHNFFKPTMIMSKRRMLNAWNWDNYFNSWAMGLRDPELAWDMYQLHFDHQLEEGALADGINERKIGFVYTKPPVHGLVLSHLLQYGAVPEQELERIYPKLLKATYWWFRFRDDDGDGICQYHHGNDSGWDDATVFDIEPPVESPDLSALLVLQLKVLAKAAERLSLFTDAENHRKKSRELLEALLGHSIRDGRFTGLQDGSHRESPADSLLLRIPVVLGKLLPRDVLSNLVSDLGDESAFLGDHGLATESMKSGEFIPDGYWRGPAWAPATMLIVYGLIDAGKTELAREISRRFCGTCRKAGFAECFNVVTGDPLHDRGYTWTASVFIILSHWLKTGDGILPLWQ